MAFYSGNYGGPLGRVDTAPMLQAAQAQAQMYQNIGKTLGSVASTYFKKKDEDKQIEALAGNDAVLQHLYAGRVDAGGLPVMPSDPKEVKKDIRALYRRVGPTGIEASLRADKAEARAQEAIRLQQETARITKERFDQQTRELEYAVNQRDIKNKVQESAYRGWMERVEETPTPRATIGGVFRGALGGAADPDRLAEASGRLGHPLSAAAATPGAGGDYSGYIEALSQPPSATPQPPPARDPAAGSKPSYLGGMLRKIGGVEIPGTTEYSALRTKETPPPINAYSSEEFTQKMMKAPGFTPEWMPFIRAMAKEEGKPSMASSTLGISSLLLSRGKTYFSEQEAVTALNDIHRDSGRALPTEAAQKSFLEKVRIVDPVDISKQAKIDFKAMNLEVPFEILSEMKKIQTLIDNARKGNPAARNAAIKTIARMFDRGPLTKDDVQGFQGGESGLGDLEQSIRDIFENKWLPGSANNLTQLVDVIKENAGMEMRERAPQIIAKLMNNFSITEEQVLKHTFLDEVLGSAKSSPEIIKGDDTFDERLVALPVGGTIIHPSHGKLIKKVSDSGVEFMVDEQGTPYSISR